MPGGNVELNGPGGAWGAQADAAMNEGWGPGWDNGDEDDIEWPEAVE